MRITALELAARYVYPAVKRRLAEKLAARGLSQAQIARLLGVTQSAVSRYLSAQRGRYDVTFSRDIDEELERVAEALLQGRLNRYCLHLELTRITILVLARGYACELHARLDPSVDPAACKTCPTLFRGLEESAKGCLGRGESGRGDEGEGRDG